MYAPRSLFLETIVDFRRRLVATTTAILLVVVREAARLDDATVVLAAVRRARRVANAKEVTRVLRLVKKFCLLAIFDGILFHSMFNLIFSWMIFNIYHNKIVGEEFFTKLTFTRSKFFTKTYTISSLFFYINCNNLNFKFIIHKYSYHDLLFTMRKCWMRK